ncbi:MAG: 5-formyltetrahydrofolate cyclo-ligase [Desulfocapsa sp.]|nr:5-formyltetrahydrofolate cyclo-ligase [Desulfocapsa sp.]
MKMDAQILRQETLARRDTLSGAEQQKKSKLIMERITKLAQFQSAATIFTYVAFRSEVATRPLIDFMLERGKRVVVPVTLVKERDLLPISISDPEQELAPGYCSIPEPIAAIRESQLVSPDTIDLVLLPGSVFDERGGRMGYGGGYYDRFVSLKAPQAMRIGLAYELQVVRRAPLQEHDELLDMILTENRSVTGERYT